MCPSTEGQVNGARSAPLTVSPPRHVAIVSDGSARWAAARGLSIAAGHEAAADTVIARIADAIDLGVAELTLYAFSTENWARPDEEIKELVAMLARRIAADAPRLDRAGVRIRFIGRRDRAGDQLREQMCAAELLTADNQGLRVYVAFDYGGRDEIVRAATLFKGGGEEEFASLLHAPEMRDPDLLIRTSGEQRLSNFLLWQAAYSELVFRAELWPDFDRAAFQECLVEYGERKRRFGGRVQTPSGASPIEPLDLEPRGLKRASVPSGVEQPG
jgi:undecaprenyl diphosphate synthase